MKYWKPLDTLAKFMAKQFKVNSEINISKWLLYNILTEKIADCVLFTSGFLWAKNIMEQSRGTCVRRIYIFFTSIRLSSISMIFNYRDYDQSAIPYFETIISSSSRWLNWNLKPSFWWITTRCMKCVKNWTLETIEIYRKTFA